jgi:hypothetical protein
MRVNLNVPIREKDQARRLGARWDPARKVWYVENVENLEAFLRWIPERLKRPVAASR